MAPRKKQIPPPILDKETAEKILIALEQDFNDFHYQFNFTIYNFRKLVYGEEINRVPIPEALKLLREYYDQKIERLEDLPHQNLDSVKKETKKTTSKRKSNTKDATQEQWYKNHIEGNINITEPERVLKI